MGIGVTLGIWKIHDLRIRYAPETTSAATPSVQQPTIMPAVTVDTTTSTVDTVRPKPSNSRSRNRANRKNKNTAQGETGSNNTDAQNDLFEENKMLREQNQCKICMDNVINIVFIPCGHISSCGDCAKSMKKCPICRKNIERKVKTYLP